MKRVLVGLLFFGFVQYANSAENITISTSSGSGFNGLLLQGSASPKVGVIMFHGRGGTPNSAVVRQMRQSLNNSGYTTLSIENPVPVDANGNGISTDFSDYVADISTGGANYVFPEAYARLNASIRLLQTQGVEQVVIAGFSLGSRLASAFVANGQATDTAPVVGLIGIGMYGTSIASLNPIFSLADITVPVLDLFGDNDTNAVNTAAAKKAAYGGAVSDYTQVVLDCPATLTVKDCHKLRGGLKGADDKPFEIAINNWIKNVAPLSVPEASSFYLLAFGLFALFGFSRRTV